MDTRDIFRIFTVLEQLSTSIKIKVMSYMKHHLARLEMMMAEEQGNDLQYKQAYNDQLMIEANGIKIELHKQETLKRLGIIK